MKPAAVGVDRPHNHQSFKSHVGACAGNAVRKQGEGVDGVEIIAVDRDRAVAMIGQRYGEPVPRLHGSRPHVG
jgi:hypothetical protein